MASSTGRWRGSTSTSRSCIVTYTSTGWWFICCLWEGRCTNMFILIIQIKLTLRVMHLRSEWCILFSFYSLIWEALSTLNIQISLKDLQRTGSSWEPCQRKCPAYMGMNGPEGPPAKWYQTNQWDNTYKVFSTYFEIPTHNVSLMANIMLWIFRYFLLQHCCCCGKIFEWIFLIDQFDWCSLTMVHYKEKK